MTVLLKVLGLGKSFGALRAVDNVSFEVGDGEVVGLIGPNGAGKTTAVNLISGAIKPSSGSVHFKGENVTALASHKLARLGLVRTFQLTNVYPGATVRDNVYVGAFPIRKPNFWGSLLGTPAYRSERRAVEERVDTLLDELGLAHLAGATAADLPYGYQKMLGLAAALAGRPRLIMLDEPAAGLSAEEADRVADLIANIRDRGVSVLIIDHNMRFMARICSRMVVLHHGTELVSGPVAEVVRDPRVLEAYLGTEHVVA